MLTETRRARVLRAATVVLTSIVACSSSAFGQVLPLPPGYEIKLADRQIATFRGPQLGGQSPSVQVVPQPDGWTEVRMLWSPFLPTAQDELSVQFDFAIQPDFHWAPHLTPFPTVVVGPHSHRAPAIIVAEGRTTLAIVPDLSIVGADSQTPWFLDLDAPARRAVVGLTNSRLAGHVFFVKEPGMVVPAAPIEIAFFVKAYTDVETVPNPWREVTALQWRRWGRPAFDAGLPNRVALSEYVETAYDWAFNRWEKPVWQEDVTGVYGGPSVVVDFAQAPGYAGPPGLPRPAEIWNQAWYHSLRGASGMYRWARRQAQPDWTRRANQLKEVALSAPQIAGGGIFPSRLQLRGQDALGRFRLELSKWRNAGRSPLEHGIDEYWFHVLDASATATWMVRWYAELDPDPRLLAYVVSYADWLLSRQAADGYFPIWLDPVTLGAQNVLVDSPESAMSATFLLELGEVTGDVRYSLAALRAVDAMILGPIAEGRWEDFETYWSDNFFGRKTLLGARVARNGMFKQNSFSIFWAAEALLRAYQVTSDKTYLAWGRRTLDELSMSQAVWQPPYMPVPVFGGFAVMNADGEWNDARQSLFAELFLEYYREVGDPDYFERGVAAMKAGFSMMFTPLNPAAYVQWQLARPSLTDRDFGFTMENYGHCGIVDDQGTGIGFFSIFDWGCGSASEGVGRILDHFGHVYIDRTRNRGFGVDNVLVERDAATGEWVLTDLVGSRRKIRIEYDDGIGQTIVLRGSARIR